MLGNYLPKSIDLKPLLIESKDSQCSRFLFEVPKRIKCMEPHVFCNPGVNIEFTLSWLIINTSRNNNTVMYHNKIKLYDYV